LLGSRLRFPGGLFGGRLLGGSLRLGRLFGSLWGLGLVAGLGLLSFLSLPLLVLGCHRSSF